MPSFGLAVWTLVGAIADGSIPRIVGAVVLFVAFVLALPGFFVVQPNQAEVLVLFGTYRGTVKQNGFWWVNPFTEKKRVSLRIRNFNSERLKVNDLKGNPIEIAAVVVWRVVDSARALFDVLLEPSGSTLMQPGKRIRIRLFQSPSLARPRKDGDSDTSIVHRQAV